MLRLADGESGQLITPLTSQTLTFIGSTGAGDDSPNYTSTSIVSDGDSLVEAISKLDTSLGAYGDHGTLSGLADDDHPQYAAIAQNETITSSWTFNNASGTFFTGTGITSQTFITIRDSALVSQFSVTSDSSGNGIAKVFNTSGTEKIHLDGGTTNPSYFLENLVIGNSAVSAGAPFGNYNLQIIDSSDAHILVESQTSGASGGGIAFWHNSSSPATTDQIFGEAIYGNDSGGNLTEYVLITVNPSSITDTSESGKYKISVANSGAMNAYFSLDGSGVPTVTFNNFPIIVQDSSDDALWRLDRGTTSDASYMENATAGTIKWLTGMLSGSSDYSIYNQNTITEIITIDTSTNEFEFNTTVLLPSDDPPDDNCSYRESTVKVWLNYVDDSGSVSNSWNISSVTDDDGDGFYYPNIDNNFASGSFAAFGCSADTTPTANFVNAGSDGSGLGIEVTVYNAAGTAVDGDFSVLAYGDQ